MKSSRKNLMSHSKNDKLYLHDRRDADGGQIQRVDSLQLHSGDKISRRRSVFWEHVRGAIGVQVVVHGAAVEVLLTGHDLMAHTTSPANRVDKRTFLVTPSTEK